MKKTAFMLIVALAVLLLSAAIVDSSLTLADYVVYNSWLGILGRWRDTRNYYHEIEFRLDGSFHEYLEATEVARGDFKPDGAHIVFYYDPVVCEYNRIDCVKRVRFDLGEATLVLGEGADSFLYSRVAEAYFFDARPGTLRACLEEGREAAARNPIRPCAALRGTSWRSGAA
ncbi:MAG: hypothetical protein JW929_15055 [Anaerolineales bacterium]|nr:hypothetical protein [Anaerolineales bacterium]